MSYKEDFVKFIVRSNVLLFGDFVTKSGRNTPYFINTGNFCTGKQADLLGQYYAACIAENMENGLISKNANVLFGPAYKGIPLAVSTAMSLSKLIDKEIYYCFDRKEAKDHGEGGNLIGYKLKDGDSVIIIEDVLTAGTAVRASIPLLKSVADVSIEGLVISVDRMEKGQGGADTAIKELQKEFGIKTFSIVNVHDIINTLYNTPVDGKIYIDDSIKERMDKYLAEYTG